MRIGGSLASPVAVVEVPYLHYTVTKAVHVFKGSLIRLQRSGVHASPALGVMTGHFEQSKGINAAGPLNTVRVCATINFVDYQ